ncbi:PREDICTED: uncharacterized protein LOC108769712 [Trachymyrmex cornetzi]|uniref:uncharacterized protein LOC108769712 n=1 Tax=Trachymyrmex cornetzi TaxID=471704 RepID=UPI00084F26C7|nr:PREDICTED: uncharacterized protein LOC108769712 [Trachymyrmex cornetzi]
MESFDLNLIQLVEKCPNLYAKSRPDYKDRNKAQNSWSSIAKTLNVEVTACQYRWGQLRERFARERRSLKAGFPSGSGSSNLPSPRTLYKSLLFLEPHVQTRRTRGNIMKKSVSLSEEDSVYWETVETVETNDPDFATDDGGKKAKKARKVEKNADDAAILAISGALQNVKELCESTGKCDDVAYNFCIMTYSQLKTMSKAKQKIARSRISSIMLELESD